MYRLLTTAILAAATTQAVQASTDCIGNMVTLTNTGFEKPQIESREVRAQVTNNSETVLSGVWVDFEIWVNNRPTKIADGTFRNGYEIAGGLLPGETFDLLDYHFMEAREVAFAQNADSIELRITTKNVLTVDGQSFPVRHAHLSDNQTLDCD